MQRLPEGKALPSFSETASGFLAFSPIKHTQCFFTASADSLSSAECLEKHSLNFCRIPGSTKCTCHAGSLTPYVTLPLSDVPVNVDTTASPAPSSLLTSYLQIYEIQTLLSQGREGWWLQMSLMVVWLGVWMWMHGRKRGEGVTTATGDLTGSVWVKWKGCPLAHQKSFCNWSRAKGPFALEFHFLSGVLSLP